jgi:hypothetical protein
LKTIFNSAGQLKAALLDRYNKNESKKEQIIAISGIAVLWYSNSLIRESPI